MKRAILAVLAISLLSSAALADDAEADGNRDTPLKIRSITIQADNIFDTSDKRENGLFYQTANALHFRTRQETVRQQLLFKEGDAFSPQLILETERLLRANRYIGKATIHTNIDGDFVDVIVETQDTWSTKPKVRASHTGGESRSELGLKEENLFGLGISADLSYKKDEQRSSYVFSVADEHLFNSWYSGKIRYVSSTDGDEKMFAVSKPFYSLDTRTSHGISYDKLIGNEAYYLLGEKYFEYNKEESDHNLFYGWSSGLQEGSTYRQSLGIHYNRQRYSDIEQPESMGMPMVTQYLATHSVLPEDRRDLYPYYGLAYLQDRYIEARNLDHIGRVEDRYVGFSGGFQIGYSSDSWGAYDDSLFLTAYAEKTFLLSDRSSLSAHGDVNLRWQDSTAENFKASFLLRYFNEHADHFKFYTDFSSVNGYKLDLQNQIFLDNDAGMRGFPTHYLSGTSAQKITFEERYYSDAKPFRIFGIGAAIFADIGHISGGNEIERAHSGTYSDIGIGLRIANNRTSDGDILHIDFAIPVGGDLPDKSFQINIEMKPRF